MVIAGVFGLIVVVALGFIGTPGPINTGREFMLALAKGDSKRLTELTYLGSQSKEQMLKKWDFATKVAAPYYRFTYRILDATQASDKVGSVRVFVTRHAEQPGSFEEHYDLPMLKEGGQWKVDVADIHRDMYPGLP